MDGWIDGWMDGWMDGERVSQSDMLLINVIDHNGKAIAQVA